MGGVDLLDQYRSYYKLELRSVKYWHLMFVLVYHWVSFGQCMGPVLSNSKSAEQRGAYHPKSIPSTCRKRPCRRLGIVRLRCSGRGSYVPVKANESSYKGSASAPPWCRDCPSWAIWMSIRPCWVLCKDSREGGQFQEAHWQTWSTGKCYISLSSFYDLPILFRGAKTCKTQENKLLEKPLCKGPC